MLNVQKDINKNADGDPTKTVVPVPTTERRFSVAQTTDKMGITTGGTIVRAFWWGLVLGAGVMVGIGMWKNKINISYTKQADAYLVFLSVKLRF